MNISEKQMKELISRGIPQEVIQTTIEFLEKMNSQLFNLAFCDDTTFRIMYRKPDGRVDCQLFPFSKI